MKVKDVMMGTPYYCQLDTNLGSATELMWIGNCGFLPVMGDDGKIVGVITDRDLCCSLMADGLDPNTTTIEKFMTLNPVTCREEEDVESCERLMQEHQIRRIPVVNAEDSVIGIVAQADLALKDKSERVSKTVAEISKPADPSAAA